MGEHGRTVTTWACCSASPRRLARRLEDHPVCTFYPDHLSCVHRTALFSALSEIVGTPLPYDDVLSVRDRLWEISPTLVRYDTTERTSVEVALAGLKTLAAATAGAKVSGDVFKKPITNFYQTDPISRACVPPLYLLLTGHSDVLSSQICHDGSMYACVHQWRQGHIGSRIHVRGGVVRMMGSVYSGCVAKTKIYHNAFVAFS